MARPLRVEYDGACYHVINRGNNKKPIFSTDRDYWFFLKKLSKYSETYEVEIYAYCLMVNHFHIYLCTPNGNLERFMRSLLTSYSMYRNSTEGTSGHVFQGRYKAVIVEHEKYAFQLSRYIHLNPVRTRQYDNLSLKDKQKALRSFTWSSYLAVIGLAKCPVWLKQDAFYRISGKLNDKQKDYAEYVEYGLLKEIENPIERVAAQSILGSDSFIDKIRRKYIVAKNGKDCPQARMLSSFMELQQLLNEVATYYGVDVDVLFAKFQKFNEPRQMALLLSKQYCRGRYPLVKLAKEFKLSVNSYSSSTYKFQKLINNNKDEQKRFNDLKENLENVKYEN